MKSFLNFINEETVHNPKELHDMGLNKSQNRALWRHDSFKTYINSYTHTTIYAKSDEDDHRYGIRHVIMTNSGNKHKMHVAITNRGKVLGHQVYHKSENPHRDAKVQWDLVKSVDGA